MSRSSRPGATAPVYAVIADIVGSRRLEDRAAAQRTILDVLATAGDGLDLLAPARATVGDEFQAVAPHLGAALSLTLRVHLLLPEGLRLRFGLGRGEVHEVDPGAEDVVQDGTAWWAAREAVDAAHALQDEGRPFALTQLRLTAEDAEDAKRGADEGGSGREERLANAMLLLRDQAVTRLQPRQRRVLGALLLGRSQVDVAREEHLSQQAVSALARGAGAGILAAQELLEALAESAGDLPAIGGEER